MQDLTKQPCYSHSHGPARQSCSDGWPWVFLGHPDGVVLLCPGGRLSAFPFICFPLVYISLPVSRRCFLYCAVSHYRTLQQQHVGESNYHRVAWEMALITTAVRLSLSNVTHAAKETLHGRLFQKRPTRRGAGFAIKAWVQVPVPLF